MIILPRQARDKHREHSTRDVLFSYSTCDGEPFSGFTVSDDGATGKKNRFWISHLSLLSLKTIIILTRRAQDRHRENSSKKAVL